MTAWRTEREALEHMIDQFGSGLFACVMDSYDYVQVGQSLSAPHLNHHSDVTRESSFVRALLPPMLAAAQCSIT